MIIKNYSLILPYGRMGVILSHIYLHVKLDCMLIRVSIINYMSINTLIDALTHELQTTTG